MDINTRLVDGVRVIELSGVLDTTSARRVQVAVLPLVEPEGRMLLDVTEVDYMSSAGLRFLLSLYRHTSNLHVRLVLVGVAEEVQDTMEVTGFADFFTVRATPTEGLALLSGDNPDARDSH